MFFRGWSGSDNDAALTLLLQWLFFPFHHFLCHIQWMAPIQAMCKTVKGKVQSPHKAVAAFTHSQLDCGEKNLCVVKNFFFLLWLHGKRSHIMQYSLHQWCLSKRVSSARQWAHRKWEKSSSASPCSGKQPLWCCKGTDAPPGLETALAARCLLWLSRPVCVPSQT